MQLAHEVESAPAKMFDGRFFITNPYTTDAMCKWNGTEYEFKALSTSPLMIMDATPLETQAIRKKFAVEIGTAEFMRSREYKGFASIEKKNKGAGIPTFAPVMKSDGSLDPSSPIAPFVQRCLEPLPVIPAKVTTRKHKDPELKRDNRGKQVIKVMGAEANGSYSLESEALQDVE